MIIEKIFSEQGGDEKLYSVSLSEIELGLYQRVFARKDYEGLTTEAAEQLKQKRSELAEELLKQRTNINKNASIGMRQVETNYLGRGLDNMSQDKRERWRNLESNSVMNQRNSAYNSAIQESNTKASKIREDLLKETKPKTLGEAISSAKTPVSPNPSKTKEAEGLLTKGINRFNKMGTLGKLGTVGLGAAAIGGLGYGAYKLSNKNKNA